jgi:uncharacterized protein
MNDRVAANAGDVLVRVCLTICLFGITACSDTGRSSSSSATPTPTPQAGCSDATYRFLEEKVPTGDGQGHGPELGSDEWKSAIESKLGIRDRPDLPDRDSEAWCRHIDKVIRTSYAASAVGTAAGPSFDCAAVEAGSIAAMICADEELSALDRQLSVVFSQASKRAKTEQPPLLQTEQRGWIKGRDDCWKDADKRECVDEAYTRRIAELQARYRLVASNGPVRFVCDGDPANEVVVTFYETDPPTLIAERGDSVSVMYLRRSASGSKYQGGNESFWEHQGQATIVWGFEVPEMTCERAG